MLWTCVSVAALVATPLHAPNARRATMVANARVRGPALSSPNGDSAVGSVPHVDLTAAAADDQGSITPTRKSESSGVRSVAILVFALSIVSWFLTGLLGGMSGPIIGGVKLVYAGAIAGVVSRSFCAPLEMVSTVMMCRGDECASMVDE